MTKQSKERYQHILSEFKQNAETVFPFAPLHTRPVESAEQLQNLSGVQSIKSDTDLEKKKQEIELDQLDKKFQSEMLQREMDRLLKKNIATLVFRFLAVETFALFFIVLLQGFGPANFKLEDSTINIFLGATLLQISSMAVIITRHLYPTSG